MSTNENILRALEQIKTLAGSTGVRPPEFRGSCSTEEIRDLERVARSKLPPEYTLFLKNCRSIEAMDFFPCISFFSPIVAALSFTSSDVPKRIHVPFPRIIEEIAVLPFASDGCDNLYLLSLSDNALGTVWSWSHEFPIRFDGVASEGLEMAQKTFYDFLVWLHREWKKFLNQNM